MFENTNQNEKNQKETVGKEEDIVLDFLQSTDVEQMVQQMALRKSFIDEKFISKNVIYPTQNKFFNMFSIPFEACNNLSK